MKQLDKPSNSIRQSVMSALVLLCLLLSPFRLAAQNQGADSGPGVPLIFDPVLLEYTEPDPENREEYQVRELSTLPSRRAEQIPVSDDSLLFDSQENSPVLYQESIDQFEIEGGSYDARLSEAYLSLGTFYQQLGDYPLAIEAFNSALHVNRINNGLFNASQLAIVNELVQSYLLAGDFIAANQQQEYLFYVQQKVYGRNTPVLVSGMLDYADWNLFAGSLSMGYVPNIASLGLQIFPLGNNLYPQGATGSFSETRAHLELAAYSYSQVLNFQRQRENISHNLDADSLEQFQSDVNLSDEDLSIPITEKKLAYTHFLLSRVLALGISDNNDANQFDYFQSLQSGSEALQRRLNYLQNSGYSDLEIVMALIDLADWLLANERWGSAEEYYAQASEYISSNSLDPVPGLDYPDLPATIPRFVSAIYSRSSYNITPDAVLEYDGYIDVSFGLTRLGYSRDLRFLNQTENTREETVEALRNILRRTQFRLQLTENERYADNQFLLRYYYTAQPVAESEEAEELEEETRE
jgi:tetratricopeptide (TPR) repeat protein